jgi:hypothetical protein
MSCLKQGVDYYERKKIGGWYSAITYGLDLVQYTLHFYSNKRLGTHLEKREAQENHRTSQGLAHEDGQTEQWEALNCSSDSPLLLHTNREMNQMTVASFRCPKWKTSNSTAATTLNSAWKIIRRADEARPAGEPKSSVVLFFRIVANAQKASFSSAIFSPHAARRSLSDITGW